jgi:hypothetical protein
MGSRKLILEGVIYREVTHVSGYGRRETLSKLDLLN